MTRPAGGAALLALLRRDPTLRERFAGALRSVVSEAGGLNASARALGVHPDAVTALADELDVEIPAGRPGPRG